MRHSSELLSSKVVLAASRSEVWVSWGPLSLCLQYEVLGRFGNLDDFFMSEICLSSRWLESEEEELHSKLVSEKTFSCCQKIHCCVMLSFGEG